MDKRYYRILVPNGHGGFTSNGRYNPYFSRVEADRDMRPGYRLQSSPNGVVGWQDEE